MYLETKENRVRLVLPFTHGVDSSAITSALSLAHHLNATLILLSLLSQGQGKGPRWEEVQQSRDFLAFAHHKATRLGVSVEQVELYTQQAPKSICAFAQEIECAGVVLAVRRGRGILLATQEVQQILEERPAPIYVASLLTRQHFLSRLLQKWRKTERKVITSMPILWGSELPEWEAIP